MHVVGDTIVDTYTYCAHDRRQDQDADDERAVRQAQVDYVGGAGIVAKHLRAAGAEVAFSTVLGDDALKDFVLEDLAEAGVECEPIIDHTRPTTNKNAIVAGGYRLLKVDTLDNRSISERIVSRCSPSRSRDDAGRCRGVQRLPPRHLQPPTPSRR